MPRAECPCPLCGREFFDGEHEYTKATEATMVPMLACPFAPAGALYFVNLKYLHHA